MMKRVIFFLMVIMTAVLAACGGAEPESAAVADPAEIDLATLPEEVDVQTTAALLGRGDVVVIDVREQWEYDEGHIPGVTHIPLAEVPASLEQIPADKTVILTCRSGNRSGQAFDFLQNNGYENVHNMQGGILAWQAAGLEVE